MMRQEREIDSGSGHLPRIINTDAVFVYSGAIIIIRELQLFGHICHTEEKRILNIAMEGTVEGTCFQGRPRRVRLWLGLSTPLGSWTCIKSWEGNSCSTHDKSWKSIFWQAAARCWSDGS